MHVVVVTPPDPFIGLAEAKKHLRVDGTDDDTLINAYIAAACGHIDGTDGWLGRAIGEQELQAQFDRFPCADGDYLDLPYPPLISVDSVVYDDDDGTEQTVDPADYSVDARGLVAAIGSTWPSTYLRRGAVRVSYTAGYVDIPASIQAAALLMIGDLYANRETATTGAASRVPMSTTVEALLAPFRVWGV